MDESVLPTSSCLLFDKALHAITAAKESLTLVFNLNTSVCSTVPAFSNLYGQAICRDPNSNLLWSLRTASHTVAVFNPLLASLPTPLPPGDLLRPDSVLLQPPVTLPADETALVTPVQLAVSLISSLDALSRGQVQATHFDVVSPF